MISDDAQSCLSCAHLDAEAGGRAPADLAVAIGYCGAAVPACVAKAPVVLDAKVSRDCASFSRRRPDLKVGDRVDVLFRDPAPRWVPHAFDGWADGAWRCGRCGSMLATKKFAATSSERKKDDLGRLRVGSRDEVAPGAPARPRRTTMTRVLVLDDDPARHRAAARAFTREAGWDLESVRTVADAKRELRSGRYVLLSLDNDLFLVPGERGSGLDVAAYVAQDMPESERPFWVNVHSQNSGAARAMRRMLRGRVAYLTTRRYAPDSRYWEVLAAKVMDRWFLS